MRWTYLKRSTSTLPVRGNGKRLLPTSVRCSPRTIIRPQDILLRLLNWRFYIGPHVQVHLAGLNTEWEERLTRWTLSVQSALEVGDALPPFPTVVAATSEGTAHHWRKTRQQGDNLNSEELFWAPQRAVRPRGAGTPQ